MDLACFVAPEERKVSSVSSLILELEEEGVGSIIASLLIRDNDSCDDPLPESSLKTVGGS
jgi:hypothetical protein